MLVIESELINAKISFKIISPKANTNSVKTNKTIFAIETNFYTGGGSKLNETARSYKNIALESNDIEGFEFVWFTDGHGWKTAKHNLEETFDVLEHLYCIADLENGIIKLLDPPFDKSNLEPGYIKMYLPGVRENGGQYTHEYCAYGHFLKQTM